MEGCPENASLGTERTAGETLTWAVDCGMRGTKYKTRPKVRPSADLRHKTYKPATVGSPKTKVKSFATHHLCD